MFNCIGKVIVVNNNGIIHFGFVKQIAPESIQVGNGDGSTTSEVDLEETGRDTENKANGNSGNSGTTGNGNSSNNGKGKTANGKSKGASKSKGKPVGKTPAAAKKTAAPAAAALPNLPTGNLGKNHPLLNLLKKGFK
jgi:hypothetical protein